ncbi:DUF998 domain-containing protein [Actinoplanes sp. GCM10030250]|uniref:DUF998 domain-containing protein n=1 Tax=Actinoplanes sp. GCM10030250 TaxID=3273376 RepID=UPI0036080D2F
MLLLAGMVAGPLYVVVSLLEILVRDGFDPTRHAWSMLANGDFGWIHSLNLIVSGLLVAAGAVGLHQKIRSGTPAVLLAIYGLGMVGSGFFAADPGRGFPAGTPEVVPISSHGTLHFALGGIGFLSLVAACLLLGRRLREEDRRGLALSSYIIGVVFLIGFVAMAASAGSAWGLLGFTGAVILASGWLTVIFAHYRAAGPKGN